MHLNNKLGNKMIVVPTKNNTIPKPSPITNIESDWPDEYNFLSFFHVTIKEATRRTDVSKGSNANTNVTISLLTHHDEFEIHSML